MKLQVLAFVGLAPFVVDALPRSHHHHHKCGGGKPSSHSSSVVSSPSSTKVAQTTSQSTNSATSILSTSSARPIETPSLTSTTSRIIITSSSTATKVTSVVTTASTDATSATPTETVIPPTTVVAVSSTTDAAQATMGIYAQATQVSFKIPATEQCGDNQILSLPGMPWTVANSMYNANQMSGSQCTNFNGILQAVDGTKEVKWTSVTDIDFVEGTKDLCKGYTNIGIATNLDKQLSAITSIPAYFSWDRTNTTAFRGSNLFDFIVAPTAGDHKSTATSEFMLWLRNWGNQVPIGYADGPVATLDLFGASWKLYEGKNPTSGVTVRSMLVDKDFETEFQGDLKEWMDAMVQKGYVSDNEYLTVGNAGTEVFYGSAVMTATVALNIKV